MAALRSEGRSHALPLWALAVFLGGGLGCGLTEPPPDAKPLVKGQEAVRDAVALAMENKDRCLEVGRGGAERLEEWSVEYQRNPGAPPPEKSFHRYIEVEAAPEIAAASETAKTIDGLIPRVKKEASPELAQAVEELARAQRVVCLRAEEKAFTAAAYEDRISEAVYGYESALAAVELRFTVTPGDRALVAARYRSALQEASDRVRRTVERAESWRRRDEPVPVAAVSSKSPEELAREKREWQEHQRLVAEKEAAHQAAVEQWRRERAKREETVPGQKVGRVDGEPVSAEAMKTWHAAYMPKAAPVRTALARYLPVARKADLDTQEICRDLRDSTAALLDDKTALDAPDRKVGRALADAYKEFQGAARACLAANPLEAHFRLRDGEAALGRAASLLEAYSLRP